MLGDSPTLVNHAVKGQLAAPVSPGVQRNAPVAACEGKILGGFSKTGMCHETRPNRRGGSAGGLFALGRDRNGLANRYDGNDRNPGNADPCVPAGSLSVCLPSGLCSSDVNALRSDSDCFLGTEIA